MRHEHTPPHSPSLVLRFIFFVLFFSIVVKRSRQKKAAAAAAAAEAAAEEASSTGSNKRQLLMQFTCNMCEGVSQYMINKDAYEEGIVICTCQTCNVKHLLADNLKKVRACPNFL